jgi:hypothetical protein
VWPISANAAESIVEGYGYSTDVIPAYINAEQRVSRRARALESLEFSILGYAREAQLASSLIFGLQDEAFVLPMWQYASRLSGTVNVGASLLPITDATLVPYRTDEYAVVWRDEFTWELFVVAGTDGSGVSTLDLALNQWNSGTAIVMPARLARMPDRVTIERPSARALASRIKFTMEQVAVPRQVYLPSTTIFGGEVNNSQWSGNVQGLGGFLGDGPNNGTLPNLALDADEGFPADEFTTFIRSNGNAVITSRCGLRLNGVVPNTTGSYLIRYRCAADNNSAVNQLYKFELYRADGKGETTAFFNTNADIFDVVGANVWMDKTTTITIGSSPSLPGGGPGSPTSAIVLHGQGNPSRRLMISAFTITPL